jgi:hypothetical protein
MASGTESGIFCLAGMEKDGSTMGEVLGKRWFRSGWGHRRTSKQYLAGLWRNSDSELSQEINAHCGLQKFGCKELALKLDDFWKRNPKRGLFGHRHP